MKELKIALLLMTHILLTAMPAAAKSEPSPAAAPVPETKYCSTPLNILFDVNKDAISDPYRNEVLQIGRLMFSTPSATATIEGHADDMPFSAAPTQKVSNYLKNMELSQRRAESVRNYLVKKFGIARSRFTVRWYGDTQKESHGDTLEARAQNRRVNVIVDCVTNK